MEKAKISTHQLFVLIVLFEFGSAILVPLAVEAKQNAWLAILIGLLGGLCIFLIYYALFSYYPDMPLTEYLQEILGSFAGKILAFFYILYFIYISARVLRDFGELLISAFFPVSPLFIMNGLMLIVVVYTIRKGIEVLARTGELLFIIIALLGIIGFILISISGNLHIANLQPVLEEGLKPVLKTAFSTLSFPFGEMIVFTMILPFLNMPEKAMKTGLSAIIVSGVILALIMAINVSVLGVSLLSRTQFPLLSTIQTIELAGFLERLDVTFMLSSVFAGFFKIGIFFYASVEGTANLFKVKESTLLVYPMGFMVLLLSIFIASNFSEHVYKGLEIVPLYIHLPFQLVIPLFLLLIAYIKNRKSKKQKECT